MKLNDNHEWVFKKPSLPSRERGLKLIAGSTSDVTQCVAPLAGAWIEIKLKMIFFNEENPVAPLAGAWIEI